MNAGYHKGSVLVLFILCLMCADNSRGQTIDEQISLFTIPNMSASFVRTASRNATQELDAVFANPAALAHLKKGIHIQLNNQFQFVRKELNTYYSPIAGGSSVYELKVNNHAFPTLFAAYKREQFTYSIALYPAMGGGGASQFENLPSVELGIADMNAALSAVARLYETRYNLSKTYSNTRYEYDFESSGIAFTPGFQFNTSYKLNDNWSFAAGIRHIRYIANAEGGADNIMVVDNHDGSAYDPRDFLNNMYASEKEVIDQKPLIDVLDVEISGNDLIQLINQIINELYTTGDTDVKQSGKGFTPIVGVQYTWNDRLQIAGNYEHRTKIKVDTEVFNEKDADGRYNNGSTLRSDLPGLISLGVRFEATDRVTLSAGSRIIFYKRADLNGRQAYVNGNYIEISGTGEYQLSDKFLISGGYAYSSMEVKDRYQNEVDYVMPTHSFAMGARYRINERIVIDAGMLNTVYKETRFTRTYEPFQGKLELPSSFDQPVKNEADGRVTLLSIGATLSIPQ